MADALERLKGNDRDAWADLYNANVNAIYRYAMFRCGNDVSLAEEITQRTFLAAVDRIGSFSGACDKLPGWLFGIARIESMRHFRRKDPVMDGAVSLDEAGAEVAMLDGASGPDAFMDSDEGRLVDKVLAEMPEPQGRALAFKYCENLPVSEVAMRMGRTEKSVESLLSRAREAFRKLYTQMLGKTERG